jgi:hypothetical protein
MGRFVEGANRNQATLLPECLEDFIAEDNPVRIVDAFVDELELASLGFDGATPAITATVLPSGRSAQNLHLRLPQSRAIKPTPGAGVSTQCRTDVADWSPRARLQDDCRVQAQ